MVSLFVWGFSSHSRFFHSYGDVTITGGGQIFPYAWHIGPMNTEVRRNEVQVKEFQTYKRINTKISKDWYMDNRAYLCGRSEYIEIICILHCLLYVTRLKISPKTYIATNVFSALNGRGGVEVERGSTPGRDRPTCRS